MKKLNLPQLSFIGFLLVNTFYNAGAQTTISNFGTNPGNINVYMYVPANMPANAPLVLVLHGCTQTASSYSTETQWNDLADRHKFYVAYGEQTSTNNSLECFNYYVTSDITRGSGEALSLKQITDYMKANYSIDSARVFVTGLSAGGAMTAVMCACYPDVFAAGAEMSGLPYGCANSELGADEACLGLVSNTPQVWGNNVRAQNPTYTGNWPRMAIFQGSADETVNIENSTEMIKQWTNVHNIGQTPGYTISSFNGNSIIQLEQFFDSSNHVPVEFYEIMNMEHGTAVYPGTCHQQGGATDALSFDESFYSPFWAAQFFGILLPAPGLDSISGLSSVSINQQGLTYSVPYSSGSAYTWAVPSGVTIVSGQGTNSITVNWGTASGTISVTEIATGGCELGPVILFVTAIVPTGSNAGDGNITTPASVVCTTSFTPVFTLSNAGTNALTSDSIYCVIDNNPAQGYAWAGSLPPAQSTTVTLPAVSVSQGNHLITIICTSPNGGTDVNPANDTVRATFTASTSPVVSLGSNVTQCGGSVGLNAQNAGDTYAWSNAATSQIDTVSQTGTYIVTVTSNGCSASGSINVSINPVPVINLTGGNVCASQLTLNADNSGSAFIWSNSATAQTITVTSSGNYSVTVTGANNCTASDSVSVNLNSNPAINLGTGGPVCGNNLTLNAGNPGASFLWSTNATTQSINVTASGVYSVTVTGGPNCSSSASVSISFDTAPVVNFGNGGSLCADNFTLNAGNPGSSYLWNTGANTQSINVTATGLYQVTVTGADNCSASASVSLAINLIPVVSLALAPDTVCASAGAVILQGGNPPGGSFSGQGVTAGILSIPASGSGSYPVTYTYTDSNGCSANASQNLLVDVCTSVNAVQENMEMTIFPNPNSTGTLHLKVGQLIPGLQVKIFDALGALAAQKNVTGQEFQLDTSPLSQGVYVISLEGNGTGVRSKLVVQ